jgi:sentrin-specific protease 1
LWKRLLNRCICVFFFLQATPQQENAFDCGVFTCQFMEGVSRGEDADTFGFNQDDMPYLRRRMLWEISQARLAGWKIAAVC